jgi:hypothetical protein
MLLGLMKNFEKLVYYSYCILYLHLGNTIQKGWLYVWWEKHQLSFLFTHQQDISICSVYMHVSGMAHIITVVLIYSSSAFSHHVVLGDEYCFLWVVGIIYCMWCICVVFVQQGYRAKFLDDKAFFITIVSVGNRLINRIPLHNTNMWYISYV